ncbi:nSTAND1 domain-containing NTPase [Microcystis aeruginosa]|nr:PD40 domain-containing protein [Microcystis aeruginosa]
MSEPSEIQQNITEAQYAAASGTGNATITITNYYYREEARIAPADSADVADDKLPCPYRGLFHFGPGDAEYFFGRESFIKTLFQATQTRNFIPLLGASGSGKSSVVFAGLVPKLQQESHWQFTHFRPGSDPFHALALALVPLYTTNLNETERLAQARQLANYLRDGDIPLADVVAQIQQNYPSERVLVIADQFEELYTLCPDETIRRNFLDKLTTSPFERVEMVLVLTMRADFLGNALSYRPFADVLQNTDLKLGPMNREELTEVIEKPAQKLGVTLEAGLVERILDDVESEPGNLPLLEFALTELWQRRQGQQLTHLAYTEIGQVQGALARHANEEYDKLSEAQREQMRRIFIQLVRPGEGTEDTRRLATKAELGAVNWALVKQLADARLVVTSRSEEAQVETVEVVHEALIRNWGELRGWMDTDRVFRAWQERLRGAMGQWQKTQGDEGSWLRGAALAEAEEQLKQRPEDISQSEQDFIRQSLQERERIKQAEAARRRREIRTAWGIAAGSLVAVVVSTGLWLRAEKQQKFAELNQANSFARYSLSLFNKGKELDAFVEAIRAGKILQQYKKAKDPLVMGVLLKALYEGRERNRLQGHDDSVFKVSFSPDGKTIISGGRDGITKFWDVETGKEISTSRGHNSINRNNNSFHRVILSSDGTIKLLNIKTGKEITTFLGHKKQVESISFSPDGKVLASGSDDKTIKLWDVDTGEEILTLHGHDGIVWSVSFSPDGKLLASGSDDKTIRLWDIEMREKIRTRHLHDKGVTSITFSPDGKILISLSSDLDSSNTIKLWDVKTGEKIHTLQGHDNPVNNQVSKVSFSPDSKILASGGFKTIKLWDVKTGEKIHTLQGHDNWITSVSFSPNGQILASSSQGQDNNLKLWNVEKGKEIRTLRGHDDSVSSISFSSDGKFLASGSEDRTIRLWDVKTGKKIRTFQSRLKALTPVVYYVTSISFSPDDKTLASGSYDGTIKLWNVDTGEEIRTIYGHEDSVVEVSFSPDGKTLASIGGDRKALASGGESMTMTTKLWDVETGEEIFTIQEHDNWLTSVSFSPDGQTLAFVSNGTIKLWDIGLDSLISSSCDWIRAYLENPNSGVRESNRHLCDR